MPKSPASDPLVPFGPKYVDVRAIPIGIYARVSTDHQVGFRFDSCEHQTLVCRDYIQRMAPCGWYEAGCFVDQAYSGANMDRPGIQALMAQIAAGRIKIVLIYKLERMLRSTYEWAKFSKFLEDHGCRLLTPYDNHSDDSAAGRFKTNMLVTMSEYERDNISEKTVDKMRAQARRGMWGGGCIPFGVLRGVATTTHSHTLRNNSALIFHPYTRHPSASTKKC